MLRHLERSMTPFYRHASSMNTDPSMDTDPSVHRDPRHEAGSHLVRYELVRCKLAAARVLGAVRGAGTLRGHLRRQLRELLRNQVMILRESLQLLVRLLQQRGIDLLGIRLLLLPSAAGLGDSVCHRAGSTHSRCAYSGT